MNPFNWSPHDRRVFSAAMGLGMIVGLLLGFAVSDDYYNNGFFEGRAPFLCYLFGWQYLSGSSTLPYDWKSLHYTLLGLSAGGALAYVLIALRQEQKPSK